MTASLKVVGKRGPKPTRKELAGRLCALAEELRSLETDDTRLAADLLTVIAFPVEHFEQRDQSNRRVAWTQGLVAALNALTVHWHAEAKWWLPAAERAELEAAEASQRGYEVSAR